MASPLRERETDHLGVVHQVTGITWSRVDTQCGIKSEWRDRAMGLFTHTYAKMDWDGFDPKPAVTCMACLVKDAQK